MEQVFNTLLAQNVRVIAHKLVENQHIGIHNDFIQGGESHRLTVQLNRGVSGTTGGYLILFQSEQPEDIHRILKPQNNTALAFAISLGSYHAVSTQYAGDRYTLVFSFYEKEF